MLKFSYEWHQGHGARINNLPIDTCPYTIDEPDNDQRDFVGSNVILCGSKYLKWRRGYWSADKECTNQEEMWYKHDSDYRQRIAYICKIAYNRGLSNPRQRNMFLDAEKPNRLFVRSFERGCRDAKKI